MTFRNVSTETVGLATDEQNQYSVPVEKPVAPEKIKVKRTRKPRAISAKSRVTNVVNKVRNKVKKPAKKK